MPAFAMKMSRRSVWEMREAAAVRIEVREEWSQGRKVRLEWAVVRDSAEVALRPVKKMRLGLCFVRCRRASLPTPPVPGGVSFWNVGMTVEGLLRCSSQSKAYHR